MIIEDISKILKTSEEEVKKIDVDMIPILIELNKKGYNTIGCCQGHYKDENDRVYIYISFKNKENVFEINPPTYISKKQNEMKGYVWLPKKYSTYQHLVLRYETKKNGTFLEKEAERKMILKDLLEWAIKLPNFKEK